MASSMSPSSTSRKSKASRTKEYEENYDSDRPPPQHARFSSRSGEANQPRVSVARVKYSFTSVTGSEFSRRESRASLAHQSYSMASSVSGVSMQTDTAARPRPSMSRRVSTLMGTGTSVYNPSASTAPRRSIAFMHEGGINNLPRRSTVGISRVQEAIDRQSTVPRLSKPPTKHEPPKSVLDSALDHDKERMWIEEKERRSRLGTVGPEEPEFNLFEKGKPCCKSRRGSQGSVGYDPNLKNMSGTDLEYQRKSITFSDKDKRRSSSAIKQLKVGSISQGCPSEYCTNKSLPDWVDGHENLDDIHAEISEFSAVNYESYANNFDLNSSIDSVDINLKSYINASLSSSIRESGMSQYRKGHKASASSSMGSRGESLIRDESLIREDSEDNGRNRTSAKNGSTSTKAENSVTNSVSSEPKGRSKASIYDSMTYKDDSMEAEYKSIESGNESPTSESKSSKTDSKAGRKKSKHGSKKSKGGSKKSKGGSKSTKTKSTSSKGSKLKSKNSQTEEKDSE